VDKPCDRHLTRPARAALPLRKLRGRNTGDAGYQHRAGADRLAATVIYHRKGELMMKLRGTRLLAAATIGILTAGAGVSADAAASTSVRTVDGTGLQRALDELVAAGAAGALVEVRDQHGVWRGTSGVARLGESQPVPANGRFRAGSITKTFVATVVLQLIGEDRLGLDDTVERWLPGLVPAGTGITVRQLLNHTSGLYDYTKALPLTDAAGVLGIRWRTWQPEELVRLATAQPPLFEPGTQWSYSSTNYILLGLLVRRVTGRPYGAEVERRIIQPLHLDGTSVPGTSPGIRGPHAHGYLPAIVDGQLSPVDITEFNPSAAWAAGEVISTAADLNRLFAALAGGRLLGATELREMTTPAPVAQYYGLGLQRRVLPCGVTVYGHDGDFPGYSNRSVVTADARRSVTVSMTWGTAAPDDFDALLNDALCPDDAG
jgi:D-alanyl-D-alanine carboxypeptidase